jgi:hypothetical protein
VQDVANDVSSAENILGVRSKFEILGGEEKMWLGLLTNKQNWTTCE